jgi:two-component system nitrate/nitrite response regulator NarL
MAIDRVMHGDNVVAHEMTSKLVAAFKEASQPGSDAMASGLAATPPEPPAASVLDSLSPRERDILRGIARGVSNKEIGRELGIAETTVKIHVQHVLRKLDVSSRVQAAVLATNAGVS